MKSEISIKNLKSFKFLKYKTLGIFSNQILHQYFLKSFISCLVSEFDNSGVTNRKRLVLNVPTSGEGR